MLRGLVVAIVMLVLGLSAPVRAQAPNVAPPGAAPFSGAAGTTKAAPAGPTATAAKPVAQAVPAKAAAAEAQAKPAEAKKAVKSPSAVKLEPNQKLCRSKQPDGAVKSWTCGKDQPCCVNHSLSLYTCGSQLLKCL